MKRVIFLSVVCLGCAKPPQEAPRLAPSPTPAGIVVEADAGYEAGWQRGYEAYIEQVGLPGTPHPTATYTSQPAAMNAEQSKAAEAGYVDGYHRASESLVCPYAGAKHR
jgi:hypothetical protein